MGDYPKLVEKWDKHTVELIKDLYSICRQEWEIDSNEMGYYHQDTAVDIAEEILYNVIHPDYTLHWYSSERPKAIRIECDPDHPVVKVWLYYPYNITVFLDCGIENDSTVIYVRVSRGGEE